jgi:hypothetical protein
MKYKIFNSVKAVNVLVLLKEGEDRTEDLISSQLIKVTASTYEKLSYACRTS